MRNFIEYLIPTVLVAILAGLLLQDHVHLPEHWSVPMPRLVWSHGDEKDAAKTVAAAPDTVRGQPESAPIAAADTLQLHLLPPTDEAGPTPAQAAPPVAAAETPSPAAEAGLQPVPAVVADPPAADAPADTVQYWPENTATIVPVTVTTSVSLAGKPDKDSVVTSHDDAPWPMLCGQVVDASGAPIAGASVELRATETTEHTDANGLFCIASPTRQVTLHVTADGRSGVEWPVSLEGRMTQAKLRLASAK